MAGCRSRSATCSRPASDRRSIAAPPPKGDAKLGYIIDRQIESFANGVTPLRFFKLMDPARPAREPLWAELLGRIGIDKHSRTWVMVNVEWPAIRRDLDAGSLATVGLVKVVSLDPNQLGLNHQVVAYGYDLDGTIVTLHIYDPNFAGADDVTLAFDTADPRATITTVWSRLPDIGLLLLPGAVRTPRSGAVPVGRPIRAAGRAAPLVSDAGCRCPTAGR